jgi:hypothetical protein
MAAPANLSLPAYPIHHYMVIIRPPLPVEQRIRKIKVDLREEFSLHGLQLQGGYILIARFSQYAQLEQKLADKIKLISMEAAPFKIELNDYFSHPDHIVGLKIANTAGIQKLQKSLREDQRLLHVPGQSAYFNAYPALSLASRLQPEQYGAIWKKYKNRHFHASFIAHQMILLRKKEGSNQWLVVDELPFQNLPVHSRQGVLFA